MRVHLVGAGGAGMSGLARILIARGDRVSGSDIRDGPAIQELRRLGMPVTIGHEGSHVEPGVERLVISAAVPPDNPEVREARTRGVPVLSYAEVLGEWTVEREGIAVAGTHGKTTTTAMLSLILLRTGADPTFLFGGECAALGGGARHGRGPHFVVEACEYRRSFHALRPRWAVVTNIEEDHLDCYAGLPEIRESFSRFARNLPEGGALLVEAGAAPVFDGIPARRLIYGVQPGVDLQGSGVVLEGGRSRFQVAFDGESVGAFQLRVPGLHNVLDALAAIGVSLELGLDPGAVAEALREFPGVRRRFEHRGEPGGVALISDYAHHPTEIRTVLHTARVRFPGRRLVVLFQPHQHHRLRALFDGFAGSFQDADEVLFADVYAVRDSAEDRARVGSRDLARAVEARGGQARATGRLEESWRVAAGAVRPGDVLLALGAGDIGERIDELARELSGVC